MRYGHGSSRIGLHALFSIWAPKVQSQFKIIYCNGSTSRRSACVIVKNPCIIVRKSGKVKLKYIQSTAYLRTSHWWHQRSKLRNMQKPIQRQSRLTPRRAQPQLLAYPSVAEPVSSHINRQSRLTRRRAQPQLLAYPSVAEHVSSHINIWWFFQTIAFWHVWASSSTTSGRGRAGPGRLSRPKQR
jgi:hypothetical protein